MSEVAGRLAVIEGATHLKANAGGRGILISGVPGTAPAEVVVIGGGVVGMNATKMAVGMGARVIVLTVQYHGCAICQIFLVTALKRAVQVMLFWQRRLPKLIWLLARF